MAPAATFDEGMHFASLPPRKMDDDRRLLSRTHTISSLPEKIRYQNITLHRRKAEFRHMDGRVVDGRSKLFRGFLPRFIQ